MKYLSTFSTRSTPQSAPIPGTTQVANRAGGYGWTVDAWMRLRRFLILGADGGTYYVNQRTLVAENAQAVIECIEADGPRAVAEIVAVSRDGRAPKNDPAIFALALATAHGDEATRKAALDALPEVCRIGTHLFHFATYVEQFRGWGRSMRRAVAGWYQRDVATVAYQAVKYRQRDGWSHRDLLRLAHPKAPSPEHDAVYRWIVGKSDGGELPTAIAAYEAAQNSPDPQTTAGLIAQYGDQLPREALRTEHLTSPAVWDALLAAGMPMTALIRNLATMTRTGLLVPGADATRTVIDRITDGERLRKARVHPIAVLAALLTYQAGRSTRGSGTWVPVPQVVDALDTAFYASFGNVRATGKRWLLALDASTSMTWGTLAGVPGLTPRVGSAAMALITAATGDPYEVVAFTSGATPVKPLPISARQRLDDVCKRIAKVDWGGTDCAAPMVWAQQQKRRVDVFNVYTDSETWAGTPHPSQALKRYREATGINAKSVVIGMTGTAFTIADPNDAGMLDVVGFDTATPNVIADFAAN